MNVEYADVRKRRCARCGRGYLPGRGAGDGMCSDSCWVASRSRQLSQGEQLSRTWQAAADRRERRIVGDYRVNRMLAAATLENDIERYKRAKRDTAELIRRLQARARGEVVRSVTPADEKCTGPDCRVCAAGRQLEAERGRRRPGEAGEYRVPPYSEYSGPAMTRVTTSDGSYAPEIYR
jgi:hypothetical protein